MTTNTVKRTPGTWFVGGVRQKVDGQEALGIFRYDEAKKRDLNIASVWYDPRDGAGTSDARLISAAPDLLECAINGWRMCHALILAAEQAGRPLSADHYAVRDLPKFEAAISRAAGSPAPQEKGSR